MRLVLGLLALVLLTAFAPAPLPRQTRRGSNLLDIDSMAGIWRTTEMYSGGNKNKLDPTSQGVAAITIKGKQWIFGRGVGTTYDMRINTAKVPAEIDFINVGSVEPYGRGLIERRAGVLRIVYNWGPRPESFDNPGSGSWDLTLVRE